MKYTIFLMFILILVSCDKMSSESKSKIIIDKKTTSKTTSKTTIDTTYKENLHLFEDYYYMMPESLCTKKETTIFYNNRSFIFDVFTSSKDSKLNRVFLKNSNTDCSDIINLYKSKYGEPKTKENKISKEIDDKVITGILKISSEYDPEIHRKITDTEFKNFVKKHPFYGREGRFFDLRVNAELHLIKEKLIMKNISTGEFDHIIVSLSRKKIEYITNYYYKTYTWIKGEKKIEINHLSKVELLNNLNNRKDNTKSMYITYTSIKENRIEQKNIKVDSNLNRKSELNTLDKI